MLHAIFQFVENVMPRAIRRNINSGGAQAGGGLRESPKIPTTSIAKDTQVLLPAFNSDPKPFIPREMSSDAHHATRAILEFLQPFPVAADMQFAKLLMPEVSCKSSFSTAQQSTSRLHYLPLSSSRLFSF
jgi:hypothetical protein